MNPKRTHWLLPDGIAESLPAQARRIERLRRRLLDLYASWGYELIITPFIEYLDALLTGTGKDLALQTFTITDQLTGRLLGVRADITPQAARIDAHQLGRSTPTRLCYFGSVLRAKPEGLSGSRNPLQIGAELFGHAGVESDFEVLCLMLATLDIAGVRSVHLDLGHVGIYRGLARQAGLSTAQEEELFAALQRKAVPEVAQLVAEWGLGQQAAGWMLALPELNGGWEVFEQARQRLQGAAAALDALDHLERLAGRLRTCQPQLPLHFDLAELRAYHYQTGVVFAAFVPAIGQEIARGGRYDHVGEKFGRARPATGFSADLMRLIQLAEEPDSETIAAVLAPESGEQPDPALEQQIETLRRSGRVVIRALPGQQGDPREMGCTHELKHDGQAWVLKDL